MIYSTPDASLYISFEHFRFATTVNSCWIFYSIFFSLPFSRSPVFLILFIRKMEALSPTLIVGSIIS